MEHGIRLIEEPELRRFIIKAVNLGLHGSAQAFQRELLRRQLTESIAA